ncbi:hypothetical protein FQN54_007806 [Arachnomyces sp. PD_36]|nr:hypothetical protein FQN54_007806 [Arachnomyces sp. PD_36]
MQFPTLVIAIMAATLAGITSASPAPAAVPVSEVHPALEARYKDCFLMCLRTNYCKEGFFSYHEQSDYPGCYQCCPLKGNL